jgi:hypothetical protein
MVAFKTFHATIFHAAVACEVSNAITNYVGDIPNRYTCDVILNQQAWVAHGGGMADSLLGDPVAGKPMAVLKDA